MIDSGWLTQGPRVEEFERAFADRVGAPEAVATTSCTTALHLALYASGVGPGDEVIVPSLSFIATANAVWHCGATPVFADIDPLTYNLDPGRRRAAAHPADQGRDAGPPGRAFRPTWTASSISPSATAWPSSRTPPARSAPSTAAARSARSGPLACFSFHPRKVITCGEGGMIAVHDPEMAERLRRLRQHAMDQSALGADMRRATSSSSTTRSAAGTPG